MTIHNARASSSVEGVDGTGSRRPTVLVTTTSDAGTYRTEQVMLGAPYLNAVQRAGATPLLVTPFHDQTAREQMLDLCQGLVLTGGEDVGPARYGEEPHPKLGLVNHARDEMELALVAAALERDLPVLAICRGMQLLNVALGGTLYQDLPSQLGGDLLHEQDAPITARWHRATVDAQCSLADVFGEAELHINSFHHQGIRDVAPALRACAWAEDGLVEAVVAPEQSWVYGVQWHPERGEAELMEDRRNPDRRLFWAFVHACRQRMEQGAVAA